MEIFFKLIKLRLEISMEINCGACAFGPKISENKSNEN